MSLPINYFICCGSDNPTGGRAGIAMAGSSAEGFAGIESKVERAPPGVAGRTTGWPSDVTEAAAGGGT